MDNFKGLVVTTERLKVSGVRRIAPFFNEIHGNLFKHFDDHYRTICSKGNDCLSDRIMYFTNIYNNISGSRTLHSIETQLIVP